MRLSLLLFMLTTLLFSGCKLFGGDDDSSDPVAAAETLRRSPIQLAKHQTTGKLDEVRPRLR